MRKLWAGSLVLLGLGLGLGSALGQTPTSKGSNDGMSWWSGMFANKPAADSKGGKKAGKSDKGQSGEGGVKTVADRAAEQQRLMQAYLRRQAVCDRLREIALDANNESLIEEAQRLDDMAWKTYQQLTSRLLGVPMNDPLAEETEPDDQGQPARNSARAMQGNAPGGPLPSRFRSEMKPTPAQARQTTRPLEDK